MGQEEILFLLKRGFYENFSSDVAQQVVQRGEEELIYMLAVEDSRFYVDRRVKNKVVFRAAYVLEAIYFTYNDRFTPFKERFIDDFPNTENQSAKRHFAKMMSDLLWKTQVNDEQADSIAQTCAKWCVEPKVRVAVQIWCIEVLIKLMNRVDWVRDVLPDLMDVLRQEATPAIKVRLREWKKHIFV